MLLKYNTFEIKGYGLELNVRYGESVIYTDPSTVPKSLSFIMVPHVVNYKKVPVN